MATLVYVDKENGDAGTVLGPKGVKIQPSAVKVLSKKPSIHNVRPRKVFNASKAPAGRKGLGNEKVNIGRDANVAAQTKPIKKPTVKASGQITRKPSDAEYPEIEKFFPYDPLDFETFDVPEEHKISHLNLAGLQLQMMDMERFERFERRMNLLLSPMKMPALNWESDLLTSPLPDLLYEEDVELPPLEE